MSEQFSRTERLIGKEAVRVLQNCRVAVFGIGGVGGYVCEALVRSGVGAFDLVDSDTVALSNLNRQIIATQKTVGRYKTEVMKERMLEINPEVNVRIHNCFFLPETAAEFAFEEYDYVVDAVDTVSAKLELIERARAAQVPVISAMGAGNKLDPSRFRVSDLYETRVCPLAKVMRRECKKRGIRELKVVWSDEEPLSPILYGAGAEEGSAPYRMDAEKVPAAAVRPAETRPRRQTPGSMSFVPSVAGLILAGEVVRDLIACRNIPRDRGV